MGRPLRGFGRGVPFLRRVRAEALDRSHRHGPAHPPQFLGLHHHRRDPGEPDRCIRAAPLQWLDARGGSRRDAGERGCRCRPAAAATCGCSSSRTWTSRKGSWRFQLRAEANSTACTAPETPLPSNLRYMVTVAAGATWINRTEDATSALGEFDRLDLLESTTPYFTGIKIHRSSSACSATSAEFASGAPSYLGLDVNGGGVQLARSHSRVCRCPAAAAATAICGCTSPRARTSNPATIAVTVILTPGCNDLNRPDPQTVSYDLTVNPAAAAGELADPQRGRAEPELLDRPRRRSGRATAAPACGSTAAARSASSLTSSCSLALITSSSAATWRMAPPTARPAPA